MSKSEAIALSVISPVYRAEGSVDELIKRVLESTRDWKTELILVDDRSPDGSWEKIRTACERHPSVRGVRLSKNFGQHTAITAGLSYARGARAIVMDCDLQHDPGYIQELMRAADRGFDIVYTAVRKRKHGFFKNLAARLFHRVFNYLSESPAMFSDRDIGAFSLLSRKVVNAYLAIQDRQRHYLLVLRWLGFRSTVVSIEHQKRHSGKSSYHFGRLLEHALSGILSQSNRLLRISISFGFFFFTIAALASAYLVCMYYLNGYREGWASTFVLILFSSGLVMMMIGVLGLYIGTIFDQVRLRPLFLVDEELNRHEP